MTPADYAAMTMKQIKKTFAYTQLASVGKSRLDKTGLCQLLSTSTSYELMTVKQIKKTFAYASAPRGKSRLNKSDLCVLLSANPLLPSTSTGTSVLSTKHNNPGESLLPSGTLQRKFNNTDDYLNASNLYHSLRSLKLQVIGFVNFPAGLWNGLKIANNEYSPSGKIVDWASIKGIEQQIGFWTIKIHSTGGRTPIKIFVKGYKNLHDMASAIQTGAVPEPVFTELFCFLLSRARAVGRTLINENLEVQVLHFKY
jgi:hypothetical protein